MRDYTIFIPEYIAAGSAVGIIGLELFMPKLRKDGLAYLTALAAVAWFVAGLFFIGKDANSFQGLIASDDFTTYFRLLAAGIVFVVALMSAHYMRDRTKTASEYYGLMLVGGCGMVYMAAATELITAYISLELLSFTLYILVGYLKRDNLSSEASLKYILLGAFSSAMFLYGMSLIYGVTGSTTYAGIAEALSGRESGTDPAVIVGFMLILAGVGFKVSAAPFHMWAPDAYEGAPMPVTAFLSTLSKAAGFALILRLFSAAIVVDAAEWRWAVMVLAALTMTMGNLIAIQ
ncbi:MAG TPA: NADH-quinone oxidoreductase subunit N, partial [Tepidiformaceae bacterium]|nr:NADH-quinone oxidoreductase subunit N [Tepidiformaceae bacterium]